VMQPHPGRVSDVLTVELGSRRDRSSPAFLRTRDTVLGMLGVEADAPSVEAYEAVA